MQETHVTFKIWFVKFFLRTDLWEIYVSWNASLTFLNFDKER
jgi:hypothetical protein